MDRAQRRVKWKKKNVFIPFLVVSMGVCAAAAGVGLQPGSRGRSSSNCKPDEFRSREGHCCNRCPPGFFLKAECAAPGWRSNCSICPKDQYQDQTNFSPNCFTCTPECNPDHNKKELSPCTYKKDRVCACQDGYTMEAISGECVFAGVSTLPALKNEEPGYHWTFWLGLSLLAVAALALALGFGIPKIRERFGSRGLQDPFQAESPAQTSLLSPTSKMESCVPESDPVSSRSPREQMPDCIPKEFKCSLFIYFVLDQVPADRFKELVRRLGVSERDIERAERDHRTFKEAQHQMLKVWGESGGGGRGTLPLPLVMELLSALRTMGLGGCAEAIELEYSIQQN